LKEDIDNKWQPFADTRSTKSTDYSLMLTSQVVEEAELLVMCAVLMDTWKRQAAAVDSLTPAEI